jgi:hypothetical protein
MECLVAPAGRRLSDAAFADGVVFADSLALGIVRVGSRNSRQKKRALTQFGLPTHIYMIVSVPLDCVRVKVVTVVCTRTVAIAEVSFAVQTGAEL